MTIIGVIAAITIPTIQTNYRREAASAKIKKFYSSINSAATRSKADGKDWEEWADSASKEVDSTAETSNQFIENYILPYMIYTKTEEKGKYTYVYLNDGTSFYAMKGQCIDFSFDTNGDKKPNKSGRDRFRFLYCPYSVSGWIANGKVIPYHRLTTTTREKAISQCKKDAGYCTGLLYMDSWVFKKDYPYKI